MEGDIIHSMEDVLIERYGVNLAESSQNRMVTDMWNWLQREVSNTTFLIITFSNTLKRIGSECRSISLNRSLELCHDRRHGRHPVTSLSD